MALIDRACVRRLLESPDPDAALVFVRGECLILRGEEIDDDHRPLVVARRQELVDFVTGGPVTDQQLDLLVDRLDNVARDLGD
ncbi:hypothetical protein OHA77_24165 [Streptosporangium sp. NBC_01639]|uniref:hypothetical protein n=1 Tax=unclassified Streptosporangium TaxID=2632669 RepID=UPI002DD848F5|nr:hypothetical protein [Streptosporangium sp. NBC_01756]WSC89557.1 hypothetical protein OIE48_15650 [Streptosporangium sp. NBC_01756]WTD51771.1 hypothetical protein OHA77_24165 [Streptosporangium sp. NBC_01639]